MSHFSRAPDRADAFRSLYESSYADLLKFVQRRTEPVNAEDVVAEAFLVVWRRFSEAPAHESDARAWVFGITRNLMLNAQRGEQRRQALGASGWWSGAVIAQLLGVHGSLKHPIFSPAPMQIWSAVASI